MLSKQRNDGDVSIQHDIYRFRKTVAVSQMSPTIKRQKPRFDSNTAPIK